MSSVQSMTLQEPPMGGAEGAYDSDSSRRSSLLSDDGEEEGNVTKRSKQPDENVREFFANFWECDFVPKLPPVICVAAMRKVSWPSTA